MTDLGNKMHAANDLRMRLTDEHDRNTAALLARRQMHRIQPAGLDEQGRYETRLSPAEASTEVGANQDNQADKLDDVVASVWFFGILAVALVAGAYLLSGGAVDVVLWVRGLL